MLPLSVEFFLEDLFIERVDEGLSTAKLVVARVVTAVFPRGVLVLSPIFLVALFVNFFCVKDYAVLLKEAVESSLC